MNIEDFAAANTAINDWLISGEAVRFDPTQNGRTEPLDIATRPTKTGEPS